MYEDTCANCTKTIMSVDKRWWLHAEGGYRGKARCDPQDSEQPYGLEATPKDNK